MKENILNLVKNSGSQLAGYYLKIRYKQQMRLESHKNRLSWPARVALVLQVQLRHSTESMQAL